MTTSLFEQLKNADPARALVGYDEAYLSAAAHTISSGSADEGTTTRPRRGAVRRLTLMAPVAAAAAAAALFFGPAIVGSPSASAEAAAMLNETAEQVTVVDPAAAPDDWWEVRTTGFSLGLIDMPSGLVAILQSRDSTAYHSVDGSRPSYFADGPTSLVGQVAGEPGVGNCAGTWQASINSRLRRSI